jgi:two-component system nitrogen regulation response regulator NtrX
MTTSSARDDLLKTVLIVDDELAIRETLEQILSYEGYEVLKAASGAEALQMVEKKEPDAILLDVKMPRMDGFEVLQKLSPEGKPVPVIVISGHGTIETAVEAVKSGAYNYLEKPLDRSRLLVTLKNCLDHFQTLAVVKVFQAQAAPASPLVGESPQMRQVRDFINRVAASDATVLVTG